MAASARQVAFGVVNDFNNILQVIGGNAEELLGAFDPADPRARAAESIVGAARQASQLARRLHYVGKGDIGTEASSAPPQEVNPAVADRRRVLLVEDDEGVREVVDDVLWNHGFSVVAYGTAEEALGHDEPFDLLLTDICLPGLNGPALAREIKRRTPGMPVILMSGESCHVDDVAELTPHGLLHKPFSSQALIDRVNHLLSA